MTEQDNSARDDPVSGSNCFVCGPDNPYGLKISFHMEGNKCCAEYCPPEHYCGFDGVTHGGILFSLLDDVMANWLYLQGESAYTGKCEIRYREPAATEVCYRLEAEQLSRRGRTAKMAGRILHPEDGRIVAEATATFVVMTS